jgi:hypothetical protein
VPVVKPPIPDTPIDPTTSSADGEARGIVGSMHQLIERHLSEDANEAMPSSRIDTAVEALSRWAAYPALLIAAAVIWSLMKAVF